ncbi:MAG TPA: YkvA family protein [Myxococcota bacterium]|nr:YkvA family protein [Myxococcota bacterium]HQK51567.1 YkvA family protein [Myxococcota bacterium]
MSKGRQGQGEYSEEAFWDKVGRYASQIGRAVLKPVLILYYTLQKPEVPVWAKTVIIGALAYFILPFDVVPDVIPGVGYSDDAGVLASAIGTVAAYIDDDVKARAQATVDSLLG